MLLTHHLFQSSQGRKDMCMCHVTSVYTYYAFQICSGINAIPPTLIFISYYHIRNYLLTLCVTSAIGFYNRRNKPLYICGQVVLWLYQVIYAKLNSMFSISVRLYIGS